MLHTGLPPLSIKIMLKQIKFVGPALCQEPALCACVCLWGGGGECAAVNNIYKGCMDPHHCV